MKDDFKNLREADQFMGDLKSYKAEQFFKSLAAEYVDEKGAVYQQEREKLEPADEISVLRLDAKMQVALLREQTVKTSRKRFAGFGTFAASLVVVCFVAAFLLMHGNPFANIYSEQNAEPAIVAGAAEILEVDAYMFGGGIEWAMPNVRIMEEAEVAWDADAAVAADAVAVPDAPSSAPVAGGGAWVEDSQDIWRYVPEEADDCVVFVIPQRAGMQVPEGWNSEVRVTMDCNEITYRFISSTGSAVSMWQGEPIHDPAQGDFRELLIGETTVYIGTDGAYSILFYNMRSIQRIVSSGRSDIPPVDSETEVQVVLSTTADYAELIELAEFWLKHE
ncbi:MAG: hypothetical protein FWB96_00160 [Defluviitaleaceae bacterium]|nr:hypothetical protein [Defluviitaleaceae bacterium]MCL2262545.1 hypothetical protein [Defluviitaleaceae bacterium]